MNNHLPFRIGFGYDVHKFKLGRPLILGGVHIPYEYGLDGHSDADVLIHAICDALLGALALGDIGVHFPDTSSEFLNIDSRILLKKSYELITNKGYILGNLDATVVAEAPKINPYVPEMKNTLSQILNCKDDQISIKATTNEKMGFVGRKEGIAAYAITSVLYCY